MIGLTMGGGELCGDACDEPFDVKYNIVGPLIVNRNVDQTHV